MEYQSADHECWKCKRITLVFTWAGHKLWHSETPPPGKPDSLRRVWSSTAGCYYWANTCTHCGALIGDWFLYCEPEGPFGDSVYEG